MSTDLVALEAEARRVAGLNQRTLSELLGCSRRTIQRLDASNGSLTAPQWCKVAGAVYPHDAALAARVAAAGGSTLEKLGLVRPAPAQTPAVVPPLGPPVATIPPALLIRHLADVVVYAAAEALAVPPQSARPALLAAFSKAVEVRLTVEDLVAALTSKRPA